MNNGTPLKIDLQTLPNVTCECGSVYFDQVIQFKKVSKLISNTGQDTLHPLPGFVCTDCGKPLNMIAEQAQVSVIDKIVQPA
jgi:hypothetical protein